jgi:Rrf2 family protein
MIRINRTTEYGLLALRYMNQKRRREDRGVTSAREIADHFGIPFEITAKTLQRLRDAGLIQSEQGARGGYTLKRSLDSVSLAEFLQRLEGPQSVVVCTSRKQTQTNCGCEYHKTCEIKGFMQELNERITGFLNNIHLSELGAGSFQKILPLQSVEGGENR